MTLCTRHRQIGEFQALEIFSSLLCHIIGLCEHVCLRATELTLWMGVASQAHTRAQTENVHSVFMINFLTLQKSLGTLGVVFFSSSCTFLPKDNIIIHFPIVGKSGNVYDAFSPYACVELCAQFDHVCPYIWLELRTF